MSSPNISPIHYQTAHKSLKLDTGGLQYQWNMIVNLIANINDMDHEPYGASPYRMEAVLEVRDRLESKLKEILDRGDPNFSRSMRTEVQLALDSMKSLSMAREDASRMNAIMTQYLSQALSSNIGSTDSNSALEAAIHASNRGPDITWTTLNNERDLFERRPDSSQYPLSNYDWPEWVCEEWEVYQFTLFHLDTFAKERLPLANVNRDNIYAINRATAAGFAEYLRRPDGFPLKSYYRFTIGGPGALVWSIEDTIKEFRFYGSEDPIEYAGYIHELEETRAKYLTFMSNERRQTRQLPERKHGSVKKVIRRRLRPLTGDGSFASTITAAAAAAVPSIQGRGTAKGKAKESSSAPRRKRAEDANKGSSSSAQRRRRAEDAGKRSSSAKPSQQKAEDAGKGSFSAKPSPQQEEDSGEGSSTPTPQSKKKINKGKNRK